MNATTSKKESRLLFLIDLALGVNAACIAAPIHPFWLSNS
jgi:hypothetical protein